MCVMHAVFKTFRSLNELQNIRLKIQHDIRPLAQNRIKNPANPQ